MRAYNTLMVRLAFMGLMLVSRGLWMSYPALWVCVAFWLVDAIWIWLNLNAGNNKILYIGIAVAAICNGLVTLANGGRMPVMDTVVDGQSIWVPAAPDHNLLLLCDRFPGGSSIGDILGLVGLLIAALVWLVGKLSARTVEEVA